MSDPMNTHDARLDSQMIADIRRARSKADDDERWSIRLTLGEVDALLRAVEARDDAIRRLVGDDEPDLPKPVRVATHRYIGNTGAPGGGDGEEVDLEATPYEHGVCRYCEERILRRGDRPWLHAGGPVGLHPAEPTA